MPSRHDAIAAFYTEKATELQGAVRHGLSGPHAMIEDACSHAWCQLLDHPEVHLDERGFRWLYVVALHHGYQLSNRSRREPAAGDASDLPLPRLRPEHPDTDSERRDVIRERLALLAELPLRRRELVFLHAAGFTYDEIARITGNSRRAVERQMLRGKRILRLRDLQRQRTA